MSVKLARFVSNFNNAIKLNIENFVVPFSTFNISLARLLKTEGLISSITIHNETSVTLQICFTERGPIPKHVTLLNRFGRVAKLRCFEISRMYRIGAPGFIVLSNLSGLTINTPGSYNSRGWGGRPIIFIKF